MLHLLVVELKTSVEGLLQYRPSRLRITFNMQINGIRQLKVYFVRKNIYICIMAMYNGNFFFLLLSSQLPMTGAIHNLNQPLMNITPSSLLFQRQIRLPPTPICTYSQSLEWHTHDCSLHTSESTTDNSLLSPESARTLAEQKVTNTSPLHSSVNHKSHTYLKFTHQSEITHSSLLHSLPCVIAHPPHILLNRRSVNCSPSSHI